MGGHGDRAPVVDRVVEQVDPGDGAVRYGQAVPDAFHGTVVLSTSSTLYCAPTASALSHTPSLPLPLLVLHASGPSTPTSVLVARLPAIPLGAAVTLDRSSLTVGAQQWRLAHHRRATVGDHGQNRGDFEPQRTSPFETGVALRVTDLVPAFCAALFRSDDNNNAAAALIDGHVRQLIGLGPGLTPSGDDALVGALAVLWTRRPALHRKLSVSILGHLRRTSLIGAHYLWLAVHGQFSEAVHMALNGEPDSLLRSGATSGADAMVGIVAAQRALARASGRTGERVPA